MKTQAALVAKQIKIELKKEFPIIEFSVKSQNFAGGNSVGIIWINGPTYMSVDKVVRKYQYGSFDGMTDCYEYTNSRDDILQVKYVQINRRISKEILDETKKEIAARFGLENIDDEQEWMRKLSRWSSDAVYSKLRTKDLTVEGWEIIYKSLIQLGK